MQEGEEATPACHQVLFVSWQISERFRRVPALPGAAKGVNEPGAVQFWLPVAERGVTGTRWFRVAHQVQVRHLETSMSPAATN